MYVFTHARFYSEGLVVKYLPSTALALHLLLYLPGKAVHPFLTVPGKALEAKCLCCRFMAGQPLGMTFANVVSPSPSIPPTCSQATPSESPDLVVYYSDICISLPLDLAPIHSPENLDLLHIPAVPCVLRGKCWLIGKRAWVIHAVGGF